MRQGYIFRSKLTQDLDWIDNHIGMYTHEIIYSIRKNVLRNFEIVNEVNDEVYISLEGDTYEK